MIGRRNNFFRAVFFAATLAAIPSVQSLASQAYIQTDITAAKIVGTKGHYVAEIKILATDVERMFLNTARERAGLDLAVPGALEREIGKLVADRVVMRGKEGVACAVKIEKAGEDPANDEGVSVVLSFECASENATYDVSKLSATMGPRASQVVRVSHNGAESQTMVHGDSAPLVLSDKR
jgi:hypothetical protein